MNRSIIISGLVLPFLFVSFLSSAADYPNILLIVSEDNGPELGCYGDPYARTPVLDRLAKTGVRFNKAFTPYSVCSPSRASFLTGLHPVVNGHLGLATHKFSLFEKWPNIFSLLRKAGYSTGLIGKLHVNPEEHFTKHLDFRAISSANFDRKSISAYAEKAGMFFSKNKKPFFLSINYPDAHFPLIAKTGGYPVKTDILTGRDVKPLPWIGCDTPRLREATANYYNCINRLDCLIGDLLGELKKAGKTENTLIIYIGDHGAQFSRGKTSVYDAGTRIPLIINWSNQISEGMVREELVCVTDILPTCLMAAGITLPSHLSGRPLQPLLLDRRVSNWRKSLQFITTGGAPVIACLQFAYRTDNFKLIITPPNQGENLSATAYLNDLNSFYIAGCKQNEIDASAHWLQQVYKIYKNPPEYELYDLKEDPNEFVNLVDDPNYNSVLSQMIKEFRKWQKNTGDPFFYDSNVRFWINEQRKARGINYKSIKNFRWGYLDKF